MTVATTATTPTSKSKKVLQRTTVGLTLSACVIGLLFLSSTAQGPRIVAVVSLGLACIVAYEVARTRIVPERSLGFALCISALATLTLFLWALDPASTLPVPDWTGGQRYAALLFLAPVTALVAFLIAWLPNSGVRGAVRDLPRMLRFSLWLALPLVCLYPVHVFMGTRGLVALVLLSKIGDTAGYYAGNAIGRTHPFPNISPGKTTAGCVASFIVATLAGGAAVAGGLLVEPRLGIWSGFLMGAWINLASQAGDLFESASKRRARIKDSGTWFGPSGGMLDLVDSLLLSVPAALVAWPLLFRIAYASRLARPLDL